MAKELRATRCVACNQTFKFPYETETKEAAVIIKMTCPYCKEKLDVDLNSVGKNTVPVFKSTDNADDGAKEIGVPILPDEIPTTLSED